MLAALRRRNFALLWFGGLISLTGDWVLRVALPFHVYQITGSALSTGLMFIAGTLPGVLLGSVAGVFVDRWNRKQTMIITNLLQSFLLLLLLMTRSVEQLWVIYLVAFVESVIAQFFGPAENALLPHLVTEEHLMVTNSLNALNNNLAMLIGPAIGGTLMGVLGLTGVVLADSASFLIAGVMISLISWSSEPTIDRAKFTEPAGAAEVAATVWKTLWQEWLEGLRLVKTDRLIAAIFIAGGIAMLGEGIFGVLLIPFVGVLQGGALVLGWLLTIRGLGGLIGGLVVGKLGSILPPTRIFPLSLGAIGLLSLLMYNFPAFLVALVVLFLIGVPAICAQVSSQTLFQSGVADQLRGRIFGAFSTMVAFLMLSGQGLASALGDRVGIVAMLNVGGGLYVLAGVVALVMMHRLFIPAGDKRIRA